MKKRLVLITLLVLILVFGFTANAHATTYYKWINIDGGAFSQSVYAKITYTTTSSSSTYTVTKVEYTHTNPFWALSAARCTFDVYTDYAWYKRDIGMQWRKTSPWLWPSQSTSGSWSPNLTLSKSGNDQFVVTVWKYPGGAIDLARSYFVELP